MDAERLKTLLEGALLAAGQPLSLTQLNSLFDEQEQPGHGLIRQALALLDAELENRAVELVETGSGYRLQIRQSLMPVVSNLWREKPPRYSRALLETLAIIAYRQPITRGEIEQIRGVSLSANILKTLQERDWIKAVGHRDVPGKPELLGTTKAFLDYFSLKGLDDLPTLAEIRDLDNIEPELELKDPDRPRAESVDDTESSEAADEHERVSAHQDDTSEDPHKHDENQTFGSPAEEDGQVSQSGRDAPEEPADRRDLEHDEQHNAQENEQENPFKTQRAND